MLHLKRGRSKTASPSNTLLKYFSPSPKNIAGLNSPINSLNASLEDLALTSPQSKRSKLDESFCATPVNLSSPNLNKKQSSPIKNTSTPIKPVTKNLSPRKSVRKLFPTATSPKSSKRKRSEIEDNYSTTAGIKIDVNANVAKALPMEEDNIQSGRRTGLSAEKFIEKSEDLLHKDFSESKVEPKMIATIKLVASNHCNYSNPETDSETSSQEGLNLFKEIAAFIQRTYNNLERRLDLNLVTSENGNFSEKILECERSEYNESLFAVVQVDSFSDTGLDLTQNYLAHKPYLSWRLLRHIVYYTMQYCDEEDWQKALKICYNHLALHPPVDDNIRHFYLALLNNEEEMGFSQKNQKGLLTYLMEEFSETYTYNSPENSKRARKKNVKYTDYMTNESVEDEENRVAENKRTPQKRGKNKDKRGNTISWISLNDGDDVNLTKTEEEINEVLQSALNDVGKKQLNSLGREILSKRQLQLFDFVISILQIDFLEWVKKSGLFARQKLVSLNKSPLVASLMWDRSIGFSSISNRIREVFHFYANSELQHRKYFEKFIAVLAEVMRIFEGEVTDLEDKQEKNQEYVNFPHIGEKCRSFADEFYFHCFGSPINMSETEVQVVYSKIKTMKPSWLRLHLLNQLLNKALGAKLTGNISSVIEVLKAFSYNDMVEPLRLAENGAMSVEVQSVKTQRNKLRSLKAVNKPDPLGETELHKLCKQRKDGELRNLLAVPSINTMVVDNNGWRPIHEAAYSGSVECCQLLVEHASSFDKKFHLLSCRSKDGCSPLLEAVNKKHVVAADYLLSVGGPFLLQQVDKNGLTVYQLMDSPGMRELRKKYVNDPVKKYISVPKHIWNLLFSIISSYFETYGSEVCLKYKDLTLTDFNDISFPNEEGSVSFIINSSLYINDLALINHLQHVIKDLKVNNPSSQQLKLLELIFS